MSKILMAALALTLSSPAVADPTVGFGLNLTYGNGSVNAGVGVRLFSDDRRDKAAASVGLDYMFGTKNWRGSLGAAYLMDNSYIELNGGYNFNGGGFDIGIGAGGVKTKRPAALPPVVPVVPGGA